MISKHQRISVIVDELLNFFFSIGTTSFNIQLDEDATDFHLKLTCNFPPAKLEQVTHLVKTLKTTPRNEIEACYGELAGDISGVHELHLIGMMIDEIEESFDDNTVHMHIIKHKSY